MMSVLSSLNEASDILTNKINVAQRKLDNLIAAKKGLQPSDQSVQVSYEGESHKLSLEKMENELELTYKQLDEFKNVLDKVELLKVKKKETDNLVNNAEEAYKEADSGENVRSLKDVDEKISFAKHRINDLNREVEELENKKSQLIKEYAAAVHSVLIDKSIDANLLKDEIQAKRLIIENYDANLQSIDKQLDDTGKKLKKSEEHLRDVTREGRLTLKMYEPNLNVGHTDDDVHQMIQNQITSTLRPFQEKLDTARKMAEEVDTEANNIIAKVSPSSFSNFLKLAALCMGVVGGALLAEVSVIGAIVALGITVTAAVIYSGYKLYNFFSNANQPIDKNTDDNCLSQPPTPQPA